MKPHWFFILLSVSAAPRYGTAIQDDVRELSDGSVRLWPATLYGSLEELVEQKWLEEVPEDKRPEGISGRERFYRITAYLSSRAAHPPDWAASQAWRRDGGPLRTRAPTSA